MNEQKIMTKQKVIKKKIGKVKLDIQKKNFP